MRGFKQARLLVLTVLCGTLVIADEQWSYKDEKLWPGKCLNGRHQSPVNLRKDTAERRVFNDIQLKNYDMKYSATIINDGHTVDVKISGGGATPSIMGGGLPHEYVLDHLHFHWESEHTIHNKRYPLEMHFAHYAKIYNSTEVAAQHADGLAVLGILFDMSKNDNPALELILEKLRQVRIRQNVDVELSKEITPLAFLPEDKENFFRYEGSLTMPGCNEAVVWTIFSDVSYISKKQLKYFSSIKIEDGIPKSNSRSLQQLNGRVVVFRSNSRDSRSSNVAESTIIGGCIKRIFGFFANVFSRFKARIKDILISIFTF